MKHKFIKALYNDKCAKCGKAKSNWQHRLEVKQNDTNSH